MRWLHIIAGLFGLVSGAVALYAVKGGKIHRKSGTVFVWTMLVMSASGAAMAAFKPERISVVAGLLAFYLVVTAMLTVRRPAENFHWLDAAAILVGLATVFLGLKFGIEGLQTADASIDDQPAVVGMVFGGIALLGVAGDAVVLRRGIKGKYRIARHLWRMCFALWIAVTSFFLGQAQVFPKPIRKFPLLVAPVILVLVIMIYWLARTLLKRKRKDTSAPEMVSEVKAEISG